MPYTPHTIVKPEKLAATAVGLLERELVTPKLFTRKGVDDFKGAKDDTLNMKVPGVLPAHDFEWRNDRSQPIQVDQYSDRKIAISFGGNAYSAVELTDEQYEFDFGAWSDLLASQTRAVARKLEYAAIQELSTANYAVTLGAKAENLGKDIVEARRVLNRLNIPGNSRTLLVGSDIEAILQSDEQFNIASIVGDANASSALKDATIGRWKGFTIVRAEDLDPTEAYALTGSAFALLNAAPTSPSRSLAPRLPSTGSPPVDSRLRPRLHGRAFCREHLVRVPDRQGPRRLVGQDAEEGGRVRRRVPRARREAEARRY